MAARRSVRYCERVVLAPGVQFDAVPSTANPATAAPILHAWQAGPQTTQLRDQLAAMPRHRDVRDDHSEGALPLPARPLRAGLRRGRLPEAQQAGGAGGRARRQPGHHGREGELQPCLHDAVRLEPDLPPRPRRQVGRRDRRAARGLGGGGHRGEGRTRPGRGHGVGDLRRTGAQRDPAAPGRSHRAERWGWSMRPALRRSTAAASRARWPARRAST